MNCPPFSISSQAINLIADISALTERYALYVEQEDALYLRRINRIRTIHSSLAIEGNTLSEEQVTAILDGKRVRAPQREITEVRNARNTYELFNELSPYSVDDLLKAHGTMMKGLVSEAGQFRTTGVGVFNGTQIIHMAPPAERVPWLMRDLFEWLEYAQDHLLIRSCVFHYEFEFIHPFRDGNGRMGRLWQSLILGQLHPIFAHLPVENLVYARQQAYYDAIAAATAASDSAPFIECMLAEIYRALKSHTETQGDLLAEEPSNDTINVTTTPCNVITNVTIDDKNDTINGKLTAKEEQLISLIRRHPRMTVKEMAENLGYSVRQMQRRLNDMQARGLIRRIGARKNGHWAAS